MCRGYSSALKIDRIGIPDGWLIRLLLLFPGYGRWLPLLQSYLQAGKVPPFGRVEVDIAFPVVTVCAETIRGMMPQTRR